MKTKEDKVQAFGAAALTNQRKNMAQQLRKTNFNLGFHHQGNNGTYFDHYKKPSQDFESNLMDQNFMTNIKNSHFTIGNSVLQQQAQSVAHSSFQGVQGGKQYISQETLQDLRRTHFILGNEGQKSYQTTTSSTFKPKTTKILNKQQRVARVQELRNHNFQLGNDNFNKASIFQTDFGEKRIQTSLKNQNLKKDLRASHFQLGNDSPTYKSINNATYKQIQGAVAAQSKKQVAGELRATHFKLGNYPSLYQSCQQAYFNKKDGQPASINQEKINDLRRSHFELGNNQGNFKSLMADSFTYPSQEILQAPILDKVSIRKTNFILGNELNSSMYNTLYKETHHGQFNNESQQLGTVDTKQLQKSNLVMGNDKPTLLSTNSTYYNKKEFSNAVLSQEKQKDLKTHHFKLGNDPNLYITIQQNSFNIKPSTQTIQSFETKADLRKSHFQLGNYPQQSQSVMSLSFNGKRSQSVEPRIYNNDLRKSNLLIGQDRQNYSTTYKNSYNEKYRYYWNYN